MKDSIVKDSFVVLSDFHSMNEPLDKIKNHYINEYDKIFILGDCTERGREGDGTGGLKILMNIKELCQKYPNRIHYIPGNHDELILVYSVALSKYEKGLSSSRTRLDEIEKNLKLNHGTQTIEDIKKLRNDTPGKFVELFNWLFDQPIQYVHEFENQKYALAHAFFDMELYNENKNLSLRGLIKYLNPEKIDNVLWFRKDKNNYDKKAVPSSEYIEVIGHTPEFIREKDLDLENQNGEKVKVFCVDGGFTYDPATQPLYKFDRKLHKTNIYSHNDTSPKSTSINVNNNVANDMSELYKTLEINDNFCNLIQELLMYNKGSVQKIKNSLWSYLYFDRFIDLEEKKIYLSYSIKKEDIINLYNKQKDLELKKKPGMSLDFGSWLEQSIEYAYCILIDKMDNKPDQKNHKK